MDQQQPGGGHLWSTGTNQVRYIKHMHAHAHVMEHNLCQKNTCTCKHACIHAHTRLVHSYSFSCLQVCGTLFLSLQLLTTTDQGTSSLGKVSPLDLSSKYLFYFHISVSCVKKLRPLSLQYLLSLDHIDDTNSQTALAAASILDVLNRPSSSSDPSALGAEAIEHLQRLHSEVAMIEGAATATAAAAAAEVGGVKEEKVKVTLKQLLEQLLENSKRQ